MFVQPALPAREKLLLKRSALLLVLLAATLVLSGAYLHRKNVTLRIGDRAEKLNTYARTVGELLAAAGVTLGPLDRVEPDPAAPVTAGLRIRVQRVVIRQETREITVPFTTLDLWDPSLAGGTARLLHTGVPGLARQVWRVVYTDGAVTAATLLGETILTAPQPAILAVSGGTVTSRGGTPNLFARAMVVTATAYAPTGALTATGTVPQLGTIAVDPRIIPLGSRLYVQGYGYGTALDTGGAIKGARVDLFFNTTREADDWGVRRVQVYILS